MRSRSRTGASSTSCPSAARRSSMQGTRSRARSPPACRPPRAPTGRGERERRPPPTSWREDLVVAASAAVPLAVFLVRERQIAGAAGFPLDDSWIHLHFARNLAEGAGSPITQASPWPARRRRCGRCCSRRRAPCWVRRSGRPRRWGSPPPQPPRCSPVTRRWRGELRRSPRSPRRWPWRGVARWCGARSPGWRSPSPPPWWRRPCWPTRATGPHGRAFAAALAVLARPESLVLVPLLLVARPIDIRRLAVFALVTTAVLAPAVWFSMVTVGSPMPATAAAKVEGGFLGWLAGVHEPWGQLLIGRPWEFALAWLRWLATINWLLPLALIAGMWVAWRRQGRALGMVTLALVAHPLGMAWLAPYRDPGSRKAATRSAPPARLRAGGHGARRAPLAPPRDRRRAGARAGPDGRGPPTATRGGSRTSTPCRYTWASG